MARREWTYRHQCKHAGCREFGFYRFDTRADLVNYQKRNAGKDWFCNRHSEPESILSRSNPKTIDEQLVLESSSGKFFGKEKPAWGFLSGNGYKVWAEDFPVGTILRVTAEIILPEEEVKKDGV